MTDTDAGSAWAGAQSSEPGASPAEKAKDAAKAVKQEAASFAGEAKDKAVEQVEQHKATAARTLTDFADAVRKAGDELADKDQSLAGRMVRQAADGLEGLSRSMSDKRPEELMEAVREFGRRNPTALVAGSVLAGLAIGRFLRSSASAGEGTASFAGGVTAPGGAPAAAPLPGDDFHSEEGSFDVAATGATSIGAPAAEVGSTISVAGDDRGELDEGAGRADRTGI